MQPASVSYGRETTAVASDSDDDDDEGGGDKGSPVQMNRADHETRTTEMTSIQVDAVSTEVQKGHANPGGSSVSSE